jgi:hypothetical protein
VVRSDYVCNTIPLDIEPTIGVFCVCLFSMEVDGAFVDSLMTNAFLELKELPGDCDFILLLK